MPLMLVLGAVRGHSPRFFLVRCLRALRHKPCAAGAWKYAATSTTCAHIRHANPKPTTSSSTSLPNIHSIIPVAF